MPNDPRPELLAAPELTIHEARELGDRAMVEAAEERAKTHNLIREAQALLKQADELLARR
jgi:hypothetical protein